MFRTKLPGQPDVLPTPACARSVLATLLGTKIGPVVKSTGRVTFRSTTPCLGAAGLRHMPNPGARPTGTAGVSSSHEVKNAGVAAL
jgi:hypothetical protein